MSTSPLDPKQKAYTLLEDFKKFAFKGNVIDLTVGVIIGAAFAKIVDSLVKSIIMPLVGLPIPGEQGYRGWKIEVGGKVIPYGEFLAEVVNFLIVAAALYLFMVKFLGMIMKKKEEEPRKLTKEQELLVEIRDLLKEMSGPDQPGPPDESPGTPLPSRG